MKTGPEGAKKGCVRIEGRSHGLPQGLVFVQGLGCDPRGHDKGAAQPLKIGPEDPEKGGSGCISKLAPEVPRLCQGTFAIADDLAKLTPRAQSPSLEEETAWLLGKAGLADQMSHISTGGVPPWTLLQGQVLPGVAAAGRAPAKVAA
eukprot:jgi/Botrbrau1/13197/Bobra.0351s0010.1